MASNPNAGNSHGYREAWLAEAMRLLAARIFKGAGYSVPNNVRVSCSFPSRGGLAPKQRVIGQAWHFKASHDGHYEIMISPTIDDALLVLATHAHELVHVTVGFECGHRGAFRKCALAIGLEGPMTATKPGVEFKHAVAPIIEHLGPYPHARLGPAFGEKGDPETTGKRPQKGRLRRAECSCCGLTLRLTQKWITGKRLVCPDADCDGKQRLLVIA